MIIAVLAILGLIFGSFVNALVWRLHEGSELRSQLAGLEAKQKPPAAKIVALKTKLQARSISKGRSMCPHCEHELAAKDLVPVLSWLYVRGRCRYCRQPISWQYPAVELLTAALFAVSFMSWPYGFHGAGLFQFVLWLGFVVAFMALAVYDLRWFLLPDRIVVPVTLLAAVQTAVMALWLHSFSALWQPVAAATVIFGLFWLLFQVSNGAWIGGGDVKLAVALGLVAGTPLKAFLVIFLASLIGTVASLPSMRGSKDKLKLRIPFGPPLLLATAIVVLYGDRLVMWYRNLLQV